jgi:hypothetical protein
VYVDKNGKWVSQISCLGKQYFLGTYNTEEEACVAWRKTSKALENGHDSVTIGTNTVYLKKDPLSHPSILPNPLKIEPTPAPVVQAVTMGGVGNMSSSFSFSQTPLISPMPHIGGQMPFAMYQNSGAAQPAVMPQQSAPQSQPSVMPQQSAPQSQPAVMPQQSAPQSQPSVFPFTVPLVPESHTNQG